MSTPTYQHTIIEGKLATKIVWATVPITVPMEHKGIPIVHDTSLSGTRGGTLTVHEPSLPGECTDPPRLPYLFSTSQVTPDADPPSIVRSETDLHSPSFVHAPSLGYRRLPSPTLPDTPPPSLVSSPLQRPRVPPSNVLTQLSNLSLTPPPVTPTPPVSPEHATSGPFFPLLDPSPLDHVDPTIKDHCLPRRKAREITGAACCRQLKPTFDAVHRSYTQVHVVQRQRAGQQLREQLRRSWRDGNDKESGVA